MSAVERVEYMDNMRAAQVTEGILKERKLQRDFFREAETTGRLVPVPPTPPQKKVSPIDEVGVPAHVATIKANPESFIAHSIGKQMWSAAAPGYIVRDGPRLASSTKQDYVYDQEELDYQKSLGHLDKTHNRRRDEFVKYVEAHAKMQNLSKGAHGAP